MFEPKMSRPENPAKETLGMSDVRATQLRESPVLDAGVTTARPSEPPVAVSRGPSAIPIEMPGPVMVKPRVVRFAPARSGGPRIGIEPEMTPAAKVPSLFASRSIVCWRKVNVTLPLTKSRICTVAEPDASSSAPVRLIGVVPTTSWSTPVSP